MELEERTVEPEGETEDPESGKEPCIGIVAYNNKVKSSLLKVPLLLLAKKGAVSSQAHVPLNFAEG